VTQPFDRAARLPAPGDPDSARGEFWVGNPWQIVSEGHNLSAYERNRMYLNRAGQGFADISYVSGTDTDGDSRAAVAADFNGDGMLDLVVRQAGGGPLLMFQNRFPRQNYLEISLRARSGNRLGIGARVELEAGGLKQTRELYSNNTFMSQTPAIVHFGVAQAQHAERLTVYWPSGTVSEFSRPPLNCHLIVVEGDTGLELHGGKHDEHPGNHR
jgi:enediyne biosynthesis protein E4